MEHYPEIQRRDGTLFFKCAEFDRAAIATSIERLIDLLDALEADPDLEDGGDLEPSHGASNDYYCRSQEDWSRIWGMDECEDEDEHGGDILDEPHDGEGDDEPCHGWTDHIDQTKANRVDLAAFQIDGSEHDLGWTGHGTGWHERDGIEDDDDDCLHDEGGADDVHAMASFDGTGHDIARDMIRGLPIAAKRADAYAMLGAELMHHFRRPVC